MTQEMGKKQPLRRTVLMYASWPLNLRMMLPVDTSHRNTWRSPPHEANLQRDRCKWQRRLGTGQRQD